MPEVPWTQLGVGGIFAFLVIKTVLDFLKAKQSQQQPDRDCPNTECRKKHDVALQQINDLHKWHDKRDENGAPVWYIKRSQEKTLDKLAIAVAAQTQLLRQWIDTQKDNAHD